MGSKTSKAKKLSSKDLKFLQTQTGMPESEITKIYDEFIENNKDGILDKSEFVRLYTRFRAEPYNNLEKIATLAFTVFDTNKNGIFFIFFQLKIFKINSFILF